MCFSATASFGVSAALLAGGIVSAKHVKTSSQIPFAMIPFVFSVQQFCEGFIWLSFKNTALESAGVGFTYAFLVFAQVVWPTLVPYAIYKMEGRNGRKKNLRLLLITGIALSIYLAFSLLYYPAKSSISNFHIRYDLSRPDQYMYITAVLYVIATIVPPFISSIKRMSAIGLFNLSSFIVTVLFFSEYLISIWCFFAAAISIGVFLVLKKTALVDNYKPSML